MKIKKVTNFLTISLLTAFTVVSLSVMGCKEQVKTDPKNPYGLDIINSLEAYSKTVEADSSNLLVDLEKHIPGVVLDIRYATENNFTGKKIYTAPKAWLRRAAADSLLKIQQILSQKGLGIKVFDAYRPYAGTLYFYEVYGDTTFVAAPWKGSIHNRGGAVDLTLINLATGEELAMPTPFDEFSEKASYHYKELPPEVLANRDKLLKVMTENGFTFYEYEWWHFNIKGRDKYSLMDISFEDLEKL
jgi:zinc D-Ala-D-Ala dipeptidase